jgi:hypothetical protein
MWAVVVRVRTAAARHPVLYWLVAGSLVVLAVWRVHAIDRATNERRAAWGDAIEVWVSTADSAIGDPIAAERRTLPAAMVPQGAVDHDPTGAPARRPRRRGEVVLDIDAEPSPLAALIPAGYVAITLEQRPLPAVAPGDAIVVVTGTGSVPGLALLVGIDTITVAVPSEQADPVATAAWSAAATVAVAAAG